jgi:proteasome lid subunit RPN8/RPN11
VEKRILYLGPLCSYIKSISSSNIEEVGYLVGIEDKKGAHIRAIVMARNIAKNPKIEFHVEPHDIIVAYVFSEIYDMEVVGFLHTHPLGSCKPSRKDIDNMRLWPLIWLIASKRCLEAYKLKEDKLVEYFISCQENG